MSRLGPNEDCIEISSDDDAAINATPTELSAASGMNDVLRELALQREARRSTVTIAAADPPCSPRPLSQSTAAEKERIQVEEEESPIMARRAKRRRTVLDSDDDHPSSTEVLRDLTEDPGSVQTQPSEATGQDEENMDMDNCVICLNPVGTEGGLAIMPCPTGKAWEMYKKKHQFCTNCIVDWAKNNETCPLCKAKFGRTQLISQDSRGVRRCITLAEVNRVEEDEDDDDEAEQGQCTVCDTQGFLIICDCCDRDFCLICSGLFSPVNVPVGEWMCRDCRPDAGDRRRRGHTQDAGGRRAREARAPQVQVEAADWRAGYGGRQGRARERREAGRPGRRERRREAQIQGIMDRVMDRINAGHEAQGAQERPAGSRGGGGGAWGRGGGGGGRGVGGRMERGAGVLRSDEEEDDMVMGARGWVRDRRLRGGGVAGYGGWLQGPQGNGRRWVRGWMGGGDEQGAGDRGGAQGEQEQDERSREQALFDEADRVQRQSKEETPQPHPHRTSALGSIPPTRPATAAPARQTRRNSCNSERLMDSQRVMEKRWHDARQRRASHGRTSDTSASSSSRSWCKAYMDERGQRVYGAEGRARLEQQRTRGGAPIGGAGRKAIDTMRMQAKPRPLAPLGDTASDGRSAGTKATRGDAPQGPCAQAKGAAAARTAEAEAAADAGARREASGPSPSARAKEEGKRSKFFAVSPALTPATTSSGGGGGGSSGGCRGWSSPSNSSGSSSCLLASLPCFSSSARKMPPSLSSAPDVHAGTAPGTKQHPLAPQPHDSPPTAAHRAGASRHRQVPEGGKVARSLESGVGASGGLGVGSSASVALKQGLPWQAASTGFASKDLPRIPRKKVKRSGEDAQLPDPA